MTLPSFAVTSVRVAESASGAAATSDSASRNNARGNIVETPLPCENAKPIQGCCQCTSGYWSQDASYYPHSPTGPDPCAPWQGCILIIDNSIIFIIIRLWIRRRGGSS